MNHASLFSGIGGAEIAAEWMGWENLFHCEINPFGRKVLEYWYPNSMSYEDITKTDFTGWRGKIDVLTAGFPCQPFSVAGQRKGADDDRYLWPQVVRVIRETRPAWVVGENVAGILTMVQPGEEVEVGSGASLFGETDRKRVLLRQEYVIETVCRGLEREGYEVQPFVIPACAVGAPHRRDRVWIVARRITPDPADTRPESLQCGRENGVHAAGFAAYTQCCGRREIHNEVQPGQPNGQRAYGNGCERLAAYTTNERLQRRMSHDTILPAEYFSYFPTQSPVCSRDDGFPIPMDRITFSKWRQEAIKAYGNAWCIPVAYEIFRAIQQVEDGMP